MVFDGIIFSLQRHGGISVYFAELLKRMPRLTEESRIVMYGDNRVSAELPREMTRLDLRPRVLERYRNVSMGGGDIFHSSYYRCSTDARARNVITVYDFIYERCQKGPRKWVHSWQKFRAIRQADAVICISENTRDDLLGFLPDVSADKVFAIPFAASDAFVRPSGGDHGAGDYVLFVGARGGYKNFTLLVESLRLLPALRLYAVGGGPFTDAEISLMNRLIPQRYQHMGAVSAEQLNDLYARAVCLAYPSAYEGFGIPVLEAMQSGCPVVALAKSSIPEVAGEAAQLLSEATPESLARAIETCLDTDIRRTMREKGFARATRFSWDRNFTDTIRVYERVLGRQLVNRDDS